MNLPGNRYAAPVAALVLILAVNLVALGGVAWNRSGDPESTLTLTQRELGTPYYGYRSVENSGVSLNIDWRTLDRDDDATADARRRYRYPGYDTRIPGWLDAEKMAQLGFAVPAPGLERDLLRYQQHALHREVLLVLELDGPAWHVARERARQRLAAERALLAANPGKTEFEQRVADMQKAFVHEEQRASRLFVVDAGLDLATLRVRYPDRAHYAIVRGYVAPTIARDKDEAHLAGYLEGIAVDSIHARAGWLPAAAPRNTALAWEAQVAWGRRLEPWIMATSAPRVVAVPPEDAN